MMEIWNIYSYIHYTSVIVNLMIGYDPIDGVHIAQDKIILHYSISFQLFPQ
jgi:hypothetical protein